MFETPQIYRTTFEALSQHYSGSADEALKDGNYVYAAQISDDSSLVKAYSNIMLGYPEKGLALLEGAVATAETLYYRAMAYWLLGDVETCRFSAESLRKSFPDAEYSELLLKLLDRKHVNILVMNREFDLGLSQTQGYFTIVSAGFSPANDIPLTLEDNAETLMAKLEDISFKPDFLFAYRPEYQLILKGLERLPFPKIAFVTDYDTHLYQKFDDFDRFDKFVVFSGVEHFEVSKFFDKPVFTHILTHSIPKKSNGTEKKSAKRRFDIHVTGSSFRSFFADKSSYFYELTQLNPGYSIRIDDGFLSKSRYHGSLEDTRFVPTYVRFYGGLPTRGVEGLSCGAKVLYPAGGMLELFLNPIIEGIHPYKPGKVKEDTELALQHRNAAVGGNVSDSVSELFCGTRTIPMFLRFCSVIALFPDQAVASGRKSPFRQDYCVVGIDDLHGGIGIGYGAEGHAANFDNMLAYNLRLPGTAQTTNSCAILAAYHLLHLQRGFTWHGKKTQESLALKAIAILEEGCRTFKNHLMLRFNLARFHYHLGDWEKSELHFRRVVTDYASLEFDPVQDDVLSALFFFEDFFPYRLYITELASSRMHRRQDCCLRNIIASSAAWYCALIRERTHDVDGAVGFGKTALELFPDNYMAQKWLSGMLLKLSQTCNDDSIADEAIGLFEKSARSFILNIHKDLLGYIQLLVSRGKLTEARTALTCWYRFFSRVRRNGVLLKVDRAFFTRLSEYEYLLPDDGRDILAKVDACLKLREYPKPLPELVQDIFIAVADFSDREDSLRSDIISGRLEITTPDAVKTIAQKFLAGADYLNSARWYARYLSRVAAGIREGEKALFSIELMECAADYLQRFPTIYRLARQVRLRFIS